MSDTREPIPVESISDFARSFAVNAPHVGWFFGAGASAAGGVPTAGQLLDDFKATLYASACNLDRSRVTMADPLVAERVRRYFDNANGLPPRGDPDEYAVAFERSYPDPAVRRQCLDRWTKQGRPSFGHRVVAALMGGGLTKWVATTNFDDLPEHAYEQLRAEHDSAERMTVAAIDSADRAARALREDDWPLMIKMHGDIASERLKNTPAELQAQDSTLRQAMLDASRRFGLAVIGYSGRDDSVMATLEEALETPDAFPHGLVWLAADPERVLSRVGELLTAARALGVNARFVEAANFDEAFGVIARHVSMPADLADWVRADRAEPRMTPVSVPTSEAGRFPALRFNALPILEYPRTALRIRCQDPPPPRLGPLLRAAHMPGAGVVTGREVLAFGVPGGWRRALRDFGPQGIEEVEIDPGAEDADTVAVGLAYEALARALAYDRPLRTRLRRRGHRVVVAHGEALRTELVPLRNAYGGPLTGTRDNNTKRWSEGVQLRLEWRLGRLWLLYEPWTFVEDVERRQSNGSSPDSRSRRRGPDPSAAWVRERWAPRRNKVWAAAVGAWADVLVGGERAELSAFGLDDPSAVDARFVIARRTAFSLPAAGERSAA